MNLYLRYRGRHFRRESTGRTKPRQTAEIVRPEDGNIEKKGCSLVPDVVRFGDVKKLRESIACSQNVEQHRVDKHEANPEERKKSVDELFPEEINKRFSHRRWKV